MAINQEKKNKGKRQPKFLLFSGLALQMGVLIYLGATFGKYLDKLYTEEKNWFTLLFTLLAIVISFYYLIKKINQINKHEDE